jgi:hypothetical protein
MMLFEFSSYASGRERNSAPASADLAAVWNFSCIVFVLVFVRDDDAGTGVMWGPIVGAILSGLGV